MEQKKLILRVLESKFGILRLEKDSEVPSWIYKSDLFSITKTPEEMSIVCQENNIPENTPAGIRVQRGWSCLKIKGPLDFGMTGILAGVSRILAENSISIFVISTYDTDYILVKETDLKKAVKTLQEEGHEIRKT